MNGDDFELELGDALDHAAAGVSTLPPPAGPELVDLRVRQRARRRRQRNLGLGAAAAVVALAGGVVALRPDPPVHIKFNAPLAGPTAGPAVATGYATGSMTGSPTGWSSPEVDPSTVQLPHITAQLDSSWTPSGLYADTSTQGSGTAAAPMAVVAGQSSAGLRYLIVSVQTPSILGPGHGGKTFQQDGLSGRILSDNGSHIGLIADVPGGHRVEVSGAGVDEATALQLVSTLHQDGGAWVMDPTDGLAPVATTVPTSSTSRSITWTQGSVGTPHTTNNQSGVSVTITTGGAYEYYGQAATLSAASAVQLGDITIAGHKDVTSMTVPSGDGSSTTLILDEQGLVYTISRWGATAGATGPLTLSAIDDAAWTQLVNTAALAQAEMRQKAIQEKNAAIRAADPTASTIDPATPGGSSTVKLPASGSPILTPPTTAPPAAGTTAGK